MTDCSEILWGGLITCGPIGNRPRRAQARPRQVSLGRDLGKIHGQDVRTHD